MSEYKKPLKYIIVVDEGGAGNLAFEAAIVFPDIFLFQHRHIAQGTHKIPSRCVKRAGFCQRGDDGKWVAYGESISLNRSSDPERDSLLLNRDYP